MLAGSNWRQFIANAYNTADYRRLSIFPEFYRGAPEESLRQIEETLGIQLPSGLRMLLSETDGVSDAMESEGHIRPVSWLIWPSTEILRLNDLYRLNPAYQASDERLKNLLFFASAGADGILFAYNLLEVPDPAIYTWFPQPGQIQLAAPALELFIQDWLSGKLKV